MGGLLRKLGQGLGSAMETVGKVGYASAREDNLERIRQEHRTAEREDMQAFQAEQGKLTRAQQQRQHEDDLALDKTQEANRLKIEEIRYNKSIDTAALKEREINARHNQDLLQKQIENEGDWSQQNADRLAELKMSKDKLGTQETIEFKKLTEFARRQGIDLAWKTTDREDKQTHEMIRSLQDYAESVQLQINDHKNKLVQMNDAQAAATQETIAKLTAKHEDITKQIAGEKERAEISAAARTGSSGGGRTPKMGELKRAIDFVTIDENGNEVKGALLIGKNGSMKKYNPVTGLIEPVRYETPEATQIREMEATYKKNIDESTSIVSGAIKEVNAKPMFGDGKLDHKALGFKTLSELRMKLTNFHAAEQISTPDIYKILSGEMAFPGQEAAEPSGNTTSKAAGSTIEEQLAEAANATPKSGADVRAEMGAKYGMEIGGKGYEAKQATKAAQAESRRAMREKMGAGEYKNDRRAMNAETSTVKASKESRTKEIMDRLQKYENNPEGAAALLNKIIANKSESNAAYAAIAKTLMMKNGWATTEGRN